MDINNTNNKQQIPFDMLAEEETQSSQAYSPYLIASHDPNMPSLEARLAAAKKSYLKDRIQNHFPLPLAISYIIYMSLVSLTAIILQTILIWNRIDYWQTFNVIRRTVFYFNFMRIMIIVVVAILVFGFSYIPWILFRFVAECHRIQSPNLCHGVGSTVTKINFWLGIASSILTLIYVILIKYLLMRGFNLDNVINQLLHAPPATTTTSPANNQQPQASKRSPPDHLPATNV